MDHRQLIVDSGKRMLSSGLTLGTWGNLSVKDPETGRIYLTPSGMSYETLQPEDVVVMDETMHVVSGNRKPTIEYAMHIGIYQNRPEIRAVLHTHPVYSQVFACLHRDIPPVTDEAAQTFGGTVRCARYALPGSQELAHHVIEALGEGNAVLMANHGAVCVGKTMDAAFKASRILEMTAQIYQMALCIGTPVEISPENVAYMREFMENRYGQR